MNFKNYDTVSPEIKEQIEKVCEIWQNHLGDALTGIYIHGSMALNCFVEETSDIDILIVTGRKLPREERLAIAEEIIDIDRKPCPLEMSAIWTGDLNPWKYPTPCQFHYSDFWTERYRGLLSGELQENFIVDSDFEDSDIACHVKLTVQCGICVCGKPILEVFPEVPEADFWDSISDGFEEYDFNAYEPRYFTSNILILGRILSYRKEKRILSKYDAAFWTRDYLPEKYRYIIENAIGVWYRGEELLEYPKEDLEGLRTFLIEEIKA